MNNELQKAAPSLALEMTYVPFGAKAEIKLTPAIVDRFITVKTRRGQTASYEDKIKFMMLCKSRELDPFVGDAFLVGYDGKDGPVFSLITAHQALLKRAEVNKDFDGMKTGILFEDKDGSLGNAEGSFVEKGQKLVGGWCRVYRKDRSHVFYHSIDLKVYDTGMSRWAKDPAGMICKVAESGALRKAFPTQIGGLYSQEEMDAEVDGRLSDKKITTVTAPTSLDDFIDVEPVIVVDETVQAVVKEPKKGTKRLQPKFSAAYRDLYAQIASCETATALDAIAQLCKIAKVEEPELADLMLYAEERKPELEGGN